MIKVKTHFINPSNPHFRTPKKCLVILPDFIGDAVLLSSIIKNLRQNFNSKCILNIVCSKSVSFLFKNAPDVNKIYLKDRIKNKTKFLQKHNYDTIIMFNYPLKWAFSAYRAKTRQRVGLSLDRLGIKKFYIWRKLLTHSIKTTPMKDVQSQISVYMHTLDNLGLEVNNEPPKFTAFAKDMLKANSLLKDIKKPIILIHAASGSIGKQWKLEYWAKTLQEIQNKFDCSFICTGIKKDIPIYEKIETLSKVKIHNFCAKTTLGETIAILSKVDIVITLDTSIAHLAAAANSPNIIVLYGPTNEKQWKPISDKSNIIQIYKELSCRPCIARFCPHKKCLNELYPEIVIERISNIMLNLINIH
ncbi:MAG: glycosyltransferase family 9 protein [Candidatus Gastranaerophilales bacterium]|nr:glycosyltransferase family 9 protein [Candidatus Gastranaerophilales bacterium]